MGNTMRPPSHADHLLPNESKNLIRDINSVLDMDPHDTDPVGTAIEQVKKDPTKTQIRATDTEADRLAEDANKCNT